MAITFVNTFDPGCTTAYINCLISAENALSSLWSNTVTLNMGFNAQPEGQNGDLASNSFFVVNESYAQLKSALASHEFSSYAQSAVASLPASDPSNGAGFDLPVGYAQMLGFSTGGATNLDTVTLNTSYGWSYGQDVISTVEHEISEGAMGRI